MNGHVEKIVESNNTRYGLIAGEDKISYYFNSKNIDCDCDFSMKDFNEGDSVVFNPGNFAFEHARWPEALQVRPSNASAGFYTPGYSYSFDMQKARRNDLKPESGEYEVLEKLKNILYISYCSHHDMGHGSVFPFCLIGNTKELRQFVRGRYEFLLVFSHFDRKDWQANTLKVARYIRARKEIADRRPLVNFYILISNANSLKEEMDKVKGGTSAAVIPFSFAEILECQNKEELRALILSRFSEYYYENNMLGEQDPIEEESLLFGDRGKIADAIVQRCMEGKNSGIFGLRRSGKSSVLRAVYRRLEYNGIKYVKIESRSFLANQDIDSCNTALFNLAKEIRKEVLGFKREEGESRSAFDARLKLSSSREDYKENAVQYFIEDVQFYTKEERQFVIALDEIETITFNTAATQTWENVGNYHDFWTALRDSGCPLIVCGINSTINEIDSIQTKNAKGELITYDNPMLERIHLCADFSKTYLPAFTDEQTRIMLNTLGGYSNVAFDNVYHEINRAFGGLPFPIRQFCAFMFEKIKDKRKLTETYQFSVAAFDAYLSEFCKSDAGKRVFSRILEHVRIYKKEYDRLKKIALSPDKYRSIPSEDMSSIDHLEKYGIINYDESTCFVTFRIKQLQEYIQSEEQKSPEDMNGEERREFVLKKVASFEQKLKRLILTRYIYDQKTGRKILLKNYDAQKKQGLYLYINKKATPVPDPNTCDFKDLFNHSFFGMYFSKLRMIISDNWKDIGPMFEEFDITKNKFNACMEDLNAGRTDAVHYDAEDMLPPKEKWEIGDETLKDFIRASEIIEKVLKKYVC